MGLKHHIIPLLLAASVSAVFAQEYEADVDSAWVASQNGGSTEISDGNESTPNAACIGDGCDGLDMKGSADDRNASSVAENSSENVTTETANATSGDVPSGSNSAAETSDANSTQAAGASTATADSKTAADSVSKVAGIQDSIEYEDCTEADSLNADCVEVAESAGDDESADPNLEETAAQYQARKEGFSKAVQLGVHAAGGINYLFGKKTDGWGLGYEVNGGIMVMLPLYRRLSLATELDFGYRHYSYEDDTDYSHNEAGIDLYLFEIPVMARYTFDDEGFFVGLGFNLGLKLNGYSEYKFDYNSDVKIDDEETSGKRNNTLPTAGVEIGGIFNLGYNITSWMAVDVRVVQSFLNLLNESNVAETSFTDAYWMSFYTTLGVAFMF